MLRSSVSALLALGRAGPANGLLEAAAGAMNYATKANPQDWSLVMKKAAEISDQSVQKPGPGEIGVCSGAPEHVYNRQAS